MHNKLVIMFNCPFVESYINKYCLGELIELGYNVTVLDLSNVLEPEYSDNTSANLATDKRFNIIHMKHYSQIDAFFETHARDSLFLPMFDYIYSARFVFKLFTKYNIDYIYTNTLLSPLLYADNRTRPSLTKDTFNIEHLKAAFYHRIWRKIYPHKQASDIFFCGKNGEEFCFSEGACGSNTKRHYLYAFDYENLIHTTPYTNNGKKYAVFIDQYIPFHPDNTIHKRLNINADDYYKQLDDMLLLIKQKLKLEIIIAAHPQANYEDKEYLTDYKIVYGKTASLIRNAELICTHFSTAGIYAVMEKKPLILMNLDCLKIISSFQDDFDNIAKAVGALIISDAQDIITKDITHIDVGKYEKCIRDNIAIEEATDKYLWERILSSI